MTNTMQALVLTTYNTALTLTEIPRPRPAKGEVLVRIHASGVNPLDCKIISGQATHAQTQLPAVPGIDLAGVVEEVGADVSRFKVGDEVYGMTGGIAGIQGSLAQYAAVDADLLAIKPRNISMREAAALPLIFITAWEGLVDRAQVSQGKKVLVHGGAGGVGHMAIQLARAYGAEVFATGKTGQQETITALGATAIDYNSTTVEQYVAQHSNGAGFDIVYDTLGGATLDASFQAARTYLGHVISCLGWGTHALAPLSFRAATYSGVFTLLPLLSGRGRAHHGEIMRAATQLIEDGKIRVLVDPQRYTLDTVAAAHQALSQRTAQGKVVVEIV
ncbi:Zinc-type alcohol dehydrogenase-like protein [compost metagenome]